VSYSSGADRRLPGWSWWSRALLLGVALAVTVAGGAGAARVGRVTEFASGINHGSYVFGIAPGADGNLWFVDQGTTSAIGRITLSGQFTEFSRGLNSGSVPSGIAPGADGNLWFTDAGSKRAIGRITRSGRITEFSAGLPPYSDPQLIAPGADGNMWFTDQSIVPSAIGRITPSGHIREFSGGLGPDSLPEGIAPGAGGDIWFTDQGTPRAVGRLSPSGIVEFSAGLNQGSAPYGIAPGADGNMWFTDAGSTKAIGRITPAGQITEFTRGLGIGSVPYGIAPGADGNLWFTDHGSTGAIGRITLSGQIKEFPTGSVLERIAPGADGNMWFTDAGNKAIGRIGTGAPPASSRAPSVTGSGRRGTVQICQGARWANWSGLQPLPSTVRGAPAYLWLRNGSPIAGHHTQRYTATRRDVGQVLACTVTVTYPVLNVTVAKTSQGVTDGKVELITCDTQSKPVTRQPCALKRLRGPVNFPAVPRTAHATLARAGMVYATGYAWHTPAGEQSRLLVVHRVVRGHNYTLVLASNHGSKQFVLRQPVMIR
jgi:streptogramin lyase